MRLITALIALVLLSIYAPAPAADPESAKAAMKKAVAFFRGQASTEGGYVYAWSSDLSMREGENKVGRMSVWIEPPGTPAVGMALLEAWARTGEPYLLQAAVDAGHCLVRGQFHSGGWGESVEFAPEVRRKIAYRVDGPLRDKTLNNSTFDDDKSQSCLRLLMRLDQALNFKDEKIHEAALYGLKAVLRVQHPNGGWPQHWDDQPHPQAPAELKASYPESWSRAFPKINYQHFVTFNDNNISRLVDTLLIAHEVYGDAAYQQAALKAGDFMILAQLPEPQPAWAQQYDEKMHPVWARKFEPPSITGGESQQIIAALMQLYQVGGDRKYLEPIPRALAWLERSKLPDGRIARFYELHTNKPLYFTIDYQLTYDDSDLPTHYAFKLSCAADQLKATYDKVVAGSKQPTHSVAGMHIERWKQPGKHSAKAQKEVDEVIAAMDSRGAWVEKGSLKHFKEAAQVIRSATFIHNLRVLGEYIQAAGK